MSAFASALHRLQERLSPRQQLALGLLVTVSGCFTAYVAAIYAAFSDFPDIDHPGSGASDAKRLVGFIVAGAGFVASGPAGYVFARRNWLRWAPAVGLAVPLAAWGLFGLVN